MRKSFRRGKPDVPDVLSGPLDDSAMLDSSLQDRPAWLVPDAFPVAVASDIPSGQTYRAWCIPVEPEGRRRLRLRRAEVRRFSIEQLESGSCVCRLSGWDDVVEWHDRNLVSVGWRMFFHHAGPPAPAGVPTPHRPSQLVSRSQLHSR